MPRMTPATFQAYARALLAALDGSWDDYQQLWLQLRDLNEHRALALDHVAGQLRRADVATRDRWLMDQARVLGPYAPAFALALARRVALHDQRAIILYELGDAAGAAVAQDQAEETARLAPERRVIGTWDKPARKLEPEGRIIGTGRPPARK